MTSSVTDVTKARLKVSEIFYSIQGESNSVGWPTVFIRLTGCPLRCQYCDTEYAFHGGKWMSLASIVEEVEQYRCRFVTVTGGEPLAQAASVDLLRQLCDRQYVVSLETSGAIDMAGVDARVIKVMDLKTPGSGEESKNNYGNLKYLSAQDQIKFVICDEPDYQWAKALIIDKRLNEVCTVLLSPSSDQLAPVILAEWLLADALPARLQLQIHKLLWGNEPGH